MSHQASLSQKETMDRLQAAMPSIPELIRKKRDGEQLTDEDIKLFINAVTAKKAQQCQIGAMLMAIWLRGMQSGEIQTLTREMMLSGEVMSWPNEWKGLVVDKHSTGGVGDKVSLVLAPALAACGCKPLVDEGGTAGLYTSALASLLTAGGSVHLSYTVDGPSILQEKQVPMISGRGLAHTGGTLDKLESIPGFNIHQSSAQVLDILGSVDCCIVGQTEMLVPADRVMYALRDATSTVDSLPLITGSIISKKGAESLSALVLDVKFGRAALYKDLQSAKELAQLLVDAGNGLGIRTGAALSRMDGTIGRCVGNSLEVMESLETLKGNGPGDLMELVTTLGGMLLLMTDMVPDLSEGRKQISDAVIGGAALYKFQAMMEAQGVANETARSLCSAHTDYFSILRKSEHQMELEAPADGVVVDVDGLALAQVIHKLGAGRSNVGEPVNHSVGLELLVSLGQRISKGAPWLRLHYEDPAPSRDQILQLQNALTLGHDANPQQGLVAEMMLPR